MDTMKKTYHLLSLCMMAMMAVVSSCSLENEVDNLSNDLLRVANVNTEGVVVIAGSDSEASLQVRANSAWVVTCDDPTLTLLTTAGSGDGEARLRMGENPSALNSRSWVVKLKSLADNNAIERAVTVTQSPNNESLNLIVTDSNVSWQAHTLTMMIESNGKWTAAITGTSGDYATLKTPSGEGNGQLVIEMAKNSTEQKRPFTVTVTGSDGKISKSVNMSQSEFGFYIELVGNKRIELARTFDPTGRTVQFRTNKNWTATVDQDWVTVSPAMGSVPTNGMDADQQVTIYANTNNNLQNREAQVVFTVRNTDNTIAATDTLHISQLSSVGLELIAPTETNLSSQAQTIALNVVSDLHWRASLAGTGATLNPTTTEGTGNGTILVNVSDNNSSSSRSFSITVSNDDNTIRKAVTFTQSGSSYYVNILGNKSISLPRVASSAKVTIAVNQSWEATASEAWLSVEPFFGDVATVGTREIQTVTVAVVGNNRAESRSGNIVFTVRNSDGSVAYTETLTVVQGSVNAPEVQQPEVFDISTRRAAFAAAYHAEPSQGAVTEYGFFWGTSPDNLTKQNHIQLTPQAGQYGYDGRFEAWAEDLQPLTTYYVVSYAVNDQGMGMSQVREFTTAGATPEEDDNQTPGL